MHRTAPLAALLLLVAPTALSADQAPQDIADYRHTFFEGLGKQMKGASTVLKGKAGRVEDLEAFAVAIHATSRIITASFPAGTGPDKVKTEALPKIWEDFKGFEAAAKTLEDESAKLVEVAKTKDLEAFKAQFGKVGKACGSCHDTFRKDED